MVPASLRLVLTANLRAALRPVLNAGMSFQVGILRPERRRTLRAYVGHSGSRTPGKTHAPRGVIMARPCQRHTFEVLAYAWR
jgi:hypothetical protein